jgi:hypothetical protein
VDRSWGVKAEASKSRESISLEAARRPMVSLSTHHPRLPRGTIPIDKATCPTVHLAVMTTVFPGYRDLFTRRLTDFGVIC